MSFEAKLIEFMIKNDFIPARIRWKKSASGVGRLFNGVFNMLDEENRKKLTKIMYDWGVSDTNRIVETLKVEKNLAIFDREGKMLKYEVI